MFQNFREFSTFSTLPTFSTWKILESSRTCSQYTHLTLAHLMGNVTHCQQVRLRIKRSTVRLPTKSMIFAYPPYPHAHVCVRPFRDAVEQTLLATVASERVDPKSLRRLQRCWPGTMRRRPSVAAGVHGCANGRCYLAYCHQTGANTMPTIGRPSKYLAPRDGPLPSCI
jgi:hypothetical protein